MKFTIEVNENWYSINNEKGEYVFVGTFSDTKNPDLWTTWNHEGLINVDIINLCFDHLKKEILTYCNDKFLTKKQIEEQIKGENNVKVNRFKKL